MGITEAASRIEREAKAFLMLTRAHTLPLETVPALVGALVAGVGGAELAIWGVFGAMYHLGGYGMNSLMDWINGYDQEDENKQHHPLNTGKMDVREAGAVCVVFVGGTLGVGATLALMYDSYAALVFMSLGFVCAVGYNQFGKRTSLKFVLISIAHSTVFAVPMLTHSAPLDLTVIGIFLIVLWVTYQISVSGEIKDITTDEDNLMKTLGARVRDMSNKDGVDDDLYMIVQTGSGYRETFQTYSEALRAAITGSMLLSYMYMSGGGVLGAVVAILITLLGIGAGQYALDIVDTGYYQRETRIKAMSIVEMLTLAMFVLVFNEYLGITWTLLLIAGSVAWVLALSRFMWGSNITPEV